MDKKLSYLLTPEPKRLRAIENLQTIQPYQSPAQFLKNRENQ